jgi:hypothetical protein
MKKLDIKINQSIISILGKKLYQSEFGTVVLRELVQNSLDANSTVIKVDYDSTDKILIVTDNGNGIQKIEGLLDTIGESVKDIDNLETIGGYGLAKLAIFGCKVWEFKSISGSFSTGFLYNPENKTESGTTVVCQFSENDLTWSYESKIESYLKSINRNVEFIYNGLPIEKPVLSSCYFGDKSEILASTRENGYAVIRVNGLPTFSKYIRNLDKTIFMDYKVTVSPYDDRYPLTSNRDSFIENSWENQDLKVRLDAIEQKLESDKKLAENIAKQDKSITFRNEKFIALGNVTKQDFIDNSQLITTWKRYLKQISDVVGYNISECSYGLTDGSDGEKACYSMDLNAFCVCKSVTDKGEILALAIHEFIHFAGYGRYGHDQAFSSYLTQYTGRIMNSIFAGEFRK